VDLTLNGKTTNFSDGAYVFKKSDGSIDAMPSKVTASGGLTVEGGPVRNAKYDSFSYRSSGNMANVVLDEKLGRLSVHMPDGLTGTSFPYPAPSAKELASAAEAKNVVIQARSGDRIIEGFFVDGKGGVLPETIQAYERGIDIKGGEFLSIHREANGDVRSLFPYKPYTPKEIEQFTQFGRYALPRNDVKNLRAINGEPLLAEANPSLNVESGKGMFPRGFKPQSVDMDLLREQFTAESVRDLQMKQQMAKEFPSIYGESLNLDANQVRENAGRMFDQNAGTVYGQRKLIADTDALINLNNARALSIAEKSGVEFLPKNELSELRLTNALAPEAETMFSKLGTILGESRLGKSLFGSGKVALGIAGAVVATELAIKGVDYARSQNQNSEEKSAALKLPDLSVQGDGSMKLASMRDDVYTQAHAERLLLQSSDKQPEKNIEPPAERPRS
jgi:hypothetical protein